MKNGISSSLMKHSEFKSLVSKITIISSNFMKRNTGKVQIFLTTDDNLSDFFVFYWSDPVFAKESNPKLSSIKSDICLTYIC